MRLRGLRIGLRSAALLASPCPYRHPRRRLSTSPSPSSSPLAEERLLAYTTGVVAAHLPPLAPLKEVTLAVNMSTYLRGRLEKQHRQQLHRQRQRTGPGGDGQPSAGAASCTSSLSDLFSKCVSLPASTARAHTLAPHMMGLYLCSRYQLLLIPPSPLAPHSSRADRASSPPATLADWLAEHDGEGVKSDDETFALLWSEAGLAKAPVVHSEREVSGSRLITRLAHATKRHATSPDADALAVLFSDVCVPFLCAFWGLPPPSQHDDGDDGAAQQGGKDALPPLGSLPALPSHDFGKHLSQSLPWPVVESYLQLGRLSSPSAAAHARAALQAMLAEQHPTWFTQAGKDGDVRLARDLVEHLLGQQQQQHQQQVVVAAARSAVAPATLRSTDPINPLPEPPPPSSVAARPAKLTPPPSPCVPLREAHPSPPPRQQPQQQQSFHQLLRTAQESPHAELVFYMAYTAMRAVFHVLLPAVGATASGRALDALADRTRWAVRYATVLGSLESFVEAFEDVFFTLQRRRGHRDPAAGEIAFVSTYTGPVGPWLLYGRVIACFFPPEREVPLGAVGEALSWGLFFAPQFGDLPTLLHRVGRHVSHATLLPLRHAASRDAGMTVRGTEEEERDQLLLWEAEAEQVARQAAWLGHLNDWLVMHTRDGRGHSEESGDREFTMAQAGAALGGGATASAHEAGGEAEAAVREAAEALPMLLRVAEQPQGQLATLLVKQTVSPSTAEMVRRFVDVYVCPLLREAAPLTVPALAREMRLRDVWSVAQQPLLRRFPTRQARAQGPAPCPSRLMEILWVYTSLWGGEEEGSFPLWRGAGHASERQEVGLRRCGPCLALRMAHSTEEGKGTVAWWVEPANGYRSPQDHVLALNGLVPMPVKCPAHSLCGGGMVTPWSPYGLALRPSAKPVSLFELLAQSEELRAVAAASAPAAARHPGESESSLPDAADLPTESADPPLEAVWMPSCAPEGGGDIIVWSAM